MMLTGNKREFIKELIEKKGLAEVRKALDEDRLRYMASEEIALYEREHSGDRFKWADVKYYISETYPELRGYKLYSEAQINEEYPMWVQKNNYPDWVNAPDDKLMLLGSKRVIDTFVSSMRDFEKQNITLSDITFHLSSMSALWQVPANVLCYMAYSWFKGVKPELGIGVIDMRIDQTEPPAEMINEQPDMVNSPGHYQLGDMEVIDIIRLVTKPLPGDEGYELGNALKYLLRYPYKGNAIQDLEKARKHVEWLIKRYG